MKLALPSQSYSVADQRELRRALELEDRRNHKRNADVEIGEGRLILTSPNGTRYAVAVSDTGTISTVAV